MPVPPIVFNHADFQSNESLQCHSHYLSIFELLSDLHGAESLYSLFPKEFQLLIHTWPHVKAKVLEVAPDLPWPDLSKGFLLHWYDYYQEFSDCLGTLPR